MCKILIVDDNTTQRNIINFMLNITLTNPVIFEAINGREAVEITMKHPEIDFIIMDLTMPILDGFDATKLIRMFNKKTIIYACSAASNISEFKQKCFEVGMNGVFNKPFTKDYVIIIRNSCLH